MGIGAFVVEMEKACADIYRRLGESSREDLLSFAQSLGCFDGYDGFGHPRYPDRGADLDVVAIRNHINWKAEEETRGDPLIPLSYPWHHHGYVSAADKRDAARIKNERIWLIRKYAQWYAAKCGGPVFVVRFCSQTGEACQPYCTTADNTAIPEGFSWRQEIFTDYDEAYAFWRKNGGSPHIEACRYFLG